MINKEEIEKAKATLKDIQEGSEMCLIAEHPKNKEDIEHYKNEVESTNTIFKYIEQLETREQKLKDKLERDIVNITKTMQDGKHYDDYSRCRLKAYRTKTKEILSIVKGEK